MNTWNETEKKLIDKGYIMIREYNPFGYAPCFKHPKTNDIKYIGFGNKILNKQEMYQDLIENWIPQSKEGIDFKLNRIKEYLQILWKN